ncbi:AAA family ATPase [Streptomyces sp. NBC_00588]|uniref:AAA family ATPase n=1 Tax=Streptomyces sp. NBC_00588 TaxID=2975784 RepID=UPI002E823C7E|nr:AAA family ATPase [Streptomyces sp. NBC_00588]WUB38451.1 AAA family ATPase [Streptomyces sp. NBC_00588]
MSEHRVGALFLGRQEQLSWLGARLKRAANSEPQVVMVDGPAGIGKTSLVRQFLVGLGPGSCVLVASGEENETHLPYAVVAQLLAHVTDDLEPPLLGLDRSLRPGAAVPDPVAVGSGLLDLVGRTQDRAPVVVIIDDAHWADTPSLHAITFALRRLRVDRVMTVLVLRDPNEPRLPPGLRRLLGDDNTLKVHVDGLGLREINGLNTALGGAPLPRWAATRLREHTRGNPLHTKALLRQFPAEVFTASSAVLPAPRAYEQLVRDRLDLCGPGARRLIEATGVLGMSAPLHLAVRIGAVSEPLDALAEAMEAELLEERTTGDVPTVAFPHPMTRAAVYQGLRPALRSQLHQQAASLADDPAQSLRHRARAAPGPDADLADELAAFAGEQAGTGAWSTAASALSAAARLATDSSTRARWFLQTMEYLLLAGDISQAAELEREARALAPSTEQHYVLGHLALTTGHLNKARDELTAAWDSCDAGTPVEMAGYTAEQLAWVHLIQGDGRGAVTWARRGLEVPAVKRHSFLRDSLAIGLAFDGRHDEAVQSVAHLPATGPRTTPAALEGLMARGLLRLWEGNLRAARRDLDQAAAAHRVVGLPMLTITSLAFLADAEYRSGRWDDAVTHGTQAVSLAEDTDQTSTLALVHALVTPPLAARGDLDAAGRHAGLSGEYARRLGDVNDAALAAVALAHVQVVRGDHEGAIAALRPLLDVGFPHRAGLDEPGIVGWRPLLAEALVRTGQLAEAGTVLPPYEARSAILDRWLDQAVAARCRGLLEAARGDADAAEASFRAALDHCARGEPCWEQALSRLAFGTFLRRAGRRGPAVAQLEAAWETFRRLGADPFLERCTTELAACGRSMTDHQEVRHVMLTPQELTVANLATRGLTNRRIARELVLSVKTIEYHLGNVYAKLGINSRTELASRLTPEE